MFLFTHSSAAHLSSITINWSSLLGEVRADLSDGRVVCDFDCGGRLDDVSVHIRTNPQFGVANKCVSPRGGDSLTHDSIVLSSR